MKKFLLSLLLVPAIASAQCLVQKDKFTGKEFKTGSVFLVGGALTPQMPMVMLLKQDQAIQFAYIMQFPLTSDSFDKEKMLCMIRFKDGTIKKLKSSASSVLTSMPNHTVSITFYADLTTEDILFFKNNPAETIRFSYKGDESFGFDTEIKSGKAKQLMKSVDCVM